MIRPERVRLGAHGDGGENRVPGMVEEVVYLGFHQEVRVRWPPARWSRSTCPTTHEHAEYEPGDAVVRAPARPPPAGAAGRRRRARARPAAAGGRMTQAGASGRPASAARRAAFVAAAQRVVARRASTARRSARSRARRGRASAC